MSLCHCAYLHGDVKSIKKKKSKFGGWVGFISINVYAWNGLRSWNTFFKIHLKIHQKYIFQNTSNNVSIINCDMAYTLPHSLCGISIINQNCFHISSYKIPSHGGRYMFYLILIRHLPNPLNWNGYASPISHHV